MAALSASSTLVITVLECRGLPKMDLFGKNDPFVEVNLTTTEGQSWREKLKSMHQETRTTSTIDGGGAAPQWNSGAGEQLTFDVGRRRPGQKTAVRVRVYDEDTGSANDLIGTHTFELPVSGPEQEGGPVWNRSEVQLLGLCAGAIRKGMSVWLPLEAPKAKKAVAKLDEARAALETAVEEETRAKATVDMLLASSPNPKRKKKEKEAAAADLAAKTAAVERATAELEKAELKLRNTVAEQAGEVHLKLEWSANPEPEPEPEPEPQPVEPEPQSQPVEPTAQARPEASSRSRLTLTVLECRNLPKMDTFGANDVFVQVQVEGETRTSSTIDGGGAAPVWEGGEQLMFELDKRRPGQKTNIRVSVFDEDKTSNDLIGRYSIELAAGGPAAGPQCLRGDGELYWTPSEWLELIPPKTTKKSPGEVRLSVTWEDLLDEEPLLQQPSQVAAGEPDGAAADDSAASSAPIAAELHPSQLYVTILECRNLPKMDTFGKNDVFVVAEVGNQTQSSSVVAGGGAAPVWAEGRGEKLVFALAPRQPREQTRLVVSVFDEDIGSNDLCGSHTIDLPLAGPSPEWSSSAQWYPLTNVEKKGKRAGDIRLLIAWSLAPTEFKPEPEPEREMMPEPELAGEQPTDSSDQTISLEELSAQGVATVLDAPDASLQRMAELEAELEAERQEIARLKQEKREREEKEAERRKPNPFAAQRAKEVCLTQRLHSFQKSKYNRANKGESEHLSGSKQLVMQEETTLREALVRVGGFPEHVMKTLTDNIDLEMVKKQRNNASFWSELAGEAQFGWGAYLLCAKYMAQNAKILHIHSVLTTYRYVYMHAVYIRAYIHTYIHTYIHAYIYVHIYTQKV